MPVVLVAPGAVAQYYDLLTMSLRTSLQRLAVHKMTPGFRWNETFADYHPGEYGTSCGGVAHTVDACARGLVRDAGGRRPLTLLLQAAITNSGELKRIWAANPPMCQGCVVSAG